MTAASKKKEEKERQQLGTNVTLNKRKRTSIAWLSTTTSKRKEKLLLR